MKECPMCHNFELYNDDSYRCPHCDAVLVTYTRKRSVTNEPNTRNSGRMISPVVNGNSKNQESTINFEPEFESQRGGRTVFRGSVVSCSVSSRYLHRVQKIANAFLRREPYQMGNPIYETVIRIEEFTNGRLSSEMRNIIFWGDAQSQINVGDDLRVEAIRRNAGYVATSIFINDTQSYVRTSFQIPATVIILFTLVIIVALIALIGAVIHAFASGAIWNWLAELLGGTVSIGLKLLSVAAPLIVIVLIIWYMFRKN